LIGGDGTITADFVSLSKEVWRMFSPMIGGGDNFWDEPDFVLTYLVTALVNGMGVEMGITLMLRGLVVSGTLVSEQTYLEAITRTLQEQINFSEADASAEAQEALKNILDLRTMSEFDPLEMFGGMTDEVDGVEDDEADDFDVDDADVGPSLIQYLHLKDPLVVTGEPPISFGEGSDIVLRLRMTAVDGWMIGRLLPDVPDFPTFGNGNITH
jgi:hypothetical protein